MEFQREPGRIWASDGEKLLAEIRFPSRNGLADITHTFVDKSLRGQGVAAQLVQAAIDQIRADGMKVCTSCSYAEKWLEQHPEASDLL